MDATVEPQGSIVLIRPLTDEARDWLKDNVDRNSYQPYWPVVVAEPRYVEDLIDGMVEAGLQVT